MTTTAMLFLMLKSIRMTLKEEEAGCSYCQTMRNLEFLFWVPLWARAAAADRVNLLSLLLTDDLKLIV